jgi:hypothetical protein
MATENLVVEQRPVRTASFDVKNRILTLPVLNKNLSSDLYDLFTGHEVGHALYTPLEGMIKVKAEKINPDVVNVVEDSRIERKVKYKYPGLKNSFARAYKELMDMDFFDVKGKDINEMNFLDRINLHCKGGAGLNVQFNDTEKELLDEVENTETYEEVIETSKKIIEYMKQQIKQQQQNKVKVKSQSEPEEDEPNNPQDYEEVEFDDDGEPLNDKPDDAPGNPENEPEEESEEENQKGQKSEDGDEEELDQKFEEEIRSHTNDSYKKNEQQLFDTSISNIIYVNIPNYDPNRVNDFKEIWYRYKKDNYGIATPQFLKIRNESNKVVSYLVKEFELRKNADQMKRANVAKTGELNMSKIYSYKFSEDIFKKITVVPGGKSHGLVMFLDWSGSMVEHIGNTMKQLISLVLFCKKMNIPYEVYAFLEDTDREMMYVKPQYKQNDLYGKDYALMNLLSSRMNSSEFTYACSALVHISGLGETTRINLPYWLSMQGTPLNQAIIHAMTIVPQFQKNNKLQIVNTIFLTDGEGSHMNRYYDVDPSKGYQYYGDYNTTYIKCDRLVMRDTVTKHEERVDLKERDAQTNALIKLLKARTNSNVIGFYVISGRDFNRKVYHWYQPGKVKVNHEELKSDFRKNQYAILENTGYDEYYILRSSSLDTDDEGFEIKENATVKSIATAFTKYNSNKHNSRVVLNRFIGLIA